MDEENQDDLVNNLENIENNIDQNLIQIVNEFDIAKIFKFENDQPLFSADEINQIDNDNQSEQITSSAVERVKKIIQETCYLYQQLDQFRLFIDQIQKKSINCIKQQQQVSNRYNDYKKIINCKWKTMLEIDFKSYDRLKLHSFALKKENTNLQKQIQEFRSTASFSTQEQLQLFSRAYPITGSNSLYMNLYSDQLACPSLKADIIYKPVLREGNKLLVREDTTGDFTITIQKNSQIIVQSNPCKDRSPQLDIEVIRDKTIENIILMQFLRDKLEIQQGPLVLNFMDCYQLEFSIEQNCTVPKNPHLYMPKKLLDIINKQEDLQVFIDYVKTFIVNQEYARQKFGEVEYTKILSKLQYDDLDFFYRLKEQKPIQPN